MSSRVLYRLLLPSMAAVLLISMAAAETIYRCEQADGSVTFSDSRCGIQAEIHRSGNSLSVVAAPNDLAERMQANRAFIAQRREHLRQQRSLTEASPEPAPKTVRTIRSQSSVLVPYWPPPQSKPSRPSPPAGRKPDPREERFSALSGRLPGTIRRRHIRDGQDDHQ